MLNLYFGCLEDELRVADDYFDNHLPDKYYVAAWSKKVIKEVAKATVLNKHKVKSSIWGVMDMKELDRSIKGLIVYRYTDKVVNLVSMGDDCIKALLDILNYKKDLTVSSLRFVNFYEYGYKGKIKILNDNTTVDNALALFHKYTEYSKEF